MKNKVLDLLKEAIKILEFECSVPIDAKVELST